jgi:oligopeptide/dipeptide ABC transporter ATP-binding protein
MRQRVMIAMAIALDPRILIADEPTTALDVTVQAQVMDLLKDLQRETGMGLVLITHDLGVVNEVADNVAVMYAGRIVETGPTDAVLAAPAHPYTEGLLASVPRGQSGREERLRPIAGAPPSLARIPSGCPFHPRCPYVIDLCRIERPPLAPRPAGESASGPASPVPVTDRPAFSAQSVTRNERPSEVGPFTSIRAAACWRSEEVSRGDG